MHIEVFGLLGWILVILMDFSAEDDEAGNQMWVLHCCLGRKLELGLQTVGVFGMEFWAETGAGILNY